jgi:nuclear GTP-binding protein
MVAKTNQKPKEFTNTGKQKGANFYQSGAKLKFLKTLKSGKAIRDAKGQIITPAQFQSRLPSGTQARVQPDRRWFENTRVIGQKDLESFRSAMDKQLNDPYAFVMRSKNLPMSLLNEAQKV